MAHYPEDFIIGLVQRVLSQSRCSIRSFARETGISKSTLYD